MFVYKNRLNEPNSWKESNVPKQREERLGQTDSFRLNQTFENYMRGRVRTNRYHDYTESDLPKLLKERESFRMNWTFKSFIRERTG